MLKIVTIIIVLLLANNAHSETISDYLIKTDIGRFKKVTKGGGAGIF